MPRKLLARFQFLAESDRYLELLEQNEIPYYLSGMGIEQGGQTNYSEALEIWVDEENFDKSVQVIKQDDYFIACPKCGSKEITEAIMENMKSNIFGVIKSLLFLGGVKSRNIVLNYKCENCQYIFK